MPGAQLLATAVLTIALPVLGAGAASAASCAGTTSAGEACVHPEGVAVDPDGGPGAGECVFLGGDECVPVFVPTPSADLTGPLVSYRCGTETC